jgi:hypothetical protein
MTVRSKLLAEQKEDGPRDTLTLQINLSRTVRSFARFIHRKSSPAGVLSFQHKPALQVTKRLSYARAVAVCTYAVASSGCPCAPFRGRQVRSEKERRQETFFPDPALYCKHIDMNRMQRDGLQ